MSSAYCLRFQERKGKKAPVGFPGIIKTNKTEIDCYFKKLMSNVLRQTVTGMLS